MRHAVIPATGKISTGSFDSVKESSSICIQRCWDQFPIQYAYGRDFQTLAAGLGILKAASNNSKLNHYESLVLSPLLRGMACGNHQLSNFINSQGQKCCRMRWRSLIFGIHFNAVREQHRSSTSEILQLNISHIGLKSWTHQHQTKQRLRGRLV